MKRLMMFLILILPLIFIHCDKDKVSNSENLLSKWEVSTLGGKSVRAIEMPYIELAAENKIFGSLGCNRVFGTFNMENGDVLLFDKLATTRMACPDGEDIEAKMLDALNYTQKYILKEGVLTLLSKEGSPLASFVAAKK